MILSNKIRLNSHWWMGLILIFCFLLDANAQGESFDFDGGSGDFIYSLKRGKNKIKNNETVDFANGHNRIKIVVGGLNGPSKLYFMPKWRTKTNSKLKNLGSTVYIRDNNRPKEIDYEILTNGKVNIKVGYHTDRNATTPLGTISFSFMAKGIKESEPVASVEVAPTPTPAPTEPTPPNNPTTEPVTNDDVSDAVDDEPTERTPEEDTKEDEKEDNVSASSTRENPPSGEGEESKEKEDEGDVPPPNVGQDREAAGSSNTIYYLLIIVPFVFLGIFLLRRNSKKDTAAIDHKADEQERIRKEALARKEEYLAKQAMEQNKKKIKVGQNNKIPENEPTPIPIPPVRKKEKLVGDQKMKFTKKENQGPIKPAGKLTPELFIENIKEYSKVNAMEHWKDSAVSKIFISPQCVEGIGEFIRATNKTAVEESDDVPPEIGGFLLGSYAMFPDKQYQISLDQFVPITPEENDVYKVAFGIQAWAKLDDIVTSSGTKADLIGWFHTHPGHGLFLSYPDLKIHNGFFTQKYKVAVEIDTMTNGFDVAFFTRKQNGVVNNDKDRKPVPWTLWEKIEKEQEEKNLEKV